MEKLDRLQNALEFQIKSFELILEEPSQLISGLFTAIRVLIANSKEEESNEKIADNDSRSIPSSSTHNNNIANDLEKIQKFHDDVKSIINTFTLIGQGGGDANLGLILPTLKGIMTKTKVVSSSGSGSSAQVDGNMCEQNAKRAKTPIPTTDSFEDEQVEAQEKQHPLKNGVVLKELFLKFKPCELFRLRLVCRQWNEIATIVLRNSDASIKLLLDRNKQTDKGFYTMKKLSQLNNVILKSPVQSFPVVCFEFNCDDLNRPEVQRFFSTYGAQIKTLKLEMNSYEIAKETEEARGEVAFTSIATFRKILIHHCKNIQFLQLDKFPTEWNDNIYEELFPEPRIGTSPRFLIPKLKKLGIYIGNFSHKKSIRIIQDIIQSSPNLNNIANYTTAFYDFSISGIENRIGSIKTLTFFPTTEDLDLYVKFAREKPRLSLIFIYLDLLDDHPELEAKLVEALEKILESSKDTLVLFHEFPALLSYVHSIKIPRLEKVKEATVTDWMFGEEKPPQMVANFEGTPQPLKLAHIFPNLTKLNLKLMSPSETSHWKNYFDFSQTLPSVKCLTIDQSCPDFVQQCSSMFPAVQNLTIGTKFENFKQNMHLIWKGFPNVRTLLVEIDGLFNVDDIDINEYDSAITGFSPEICVQLRNNSRRVKADEISALRLFPSICDAKNLQSFTMEFQYLEDDITQHIFSHLAALFGFCPMRQKNQLVFKVRDNNGGSNYERFDAALQCIAHYLN